MNITHRTVAQRPPSRKSIAFLLSFCSLVGWSSLCQARPAETGGSEQGDDDEIQIIIAVPKPVPLILLAPDKRLFEHPAMAGEETRWGDGTDVGLDRLLQRLDETTSHLAEAESRGDRPGQLRALVRLGWLRYLEGLERHEQALNDWEQTGFSGGAEPPPKPEPDFAPALEALARVVKTFSDDQEADLAWYMYGWVLRAAGREAEAVETLAGLEGRFAASIFRRSAWFLAGKTCFDGCRYADALTCFSRAADLTAEGRVYELSLYMKALCAFRTNQYPIAFSVLFRLLDSYDMESSGVPGLLRSEAVRAVTLGLLDDDWDGDGKLDADWSVERSFRYLRRGRPYEREVLAELGEDHFSLRMERTLKAAIAEFHEYIFRYPLDPDNSRRYDKIIHAYQLLADEPALSAQERARLAMETVDQLALVDVLFGPGSGWAEHGAVGAERRSEVKALLQNSREARVRLCLWLADDLMQRGAQEEAKRYYREAASIVEQELARSDPSETTLCFLAGVAETVAQFFGRVSDVQALLERHRDRFATFEDLDCPLDAALKAIGKLEGQPAAPEARLSGPKPASENCDGPAERCGPDVQKAMDRFLVRDFKRIRQCLSVGEAADGDSDLPPGKIVLRIKIVTNKSAEATVGAASVSPDAARCIASVVESWPFPRPVGQGIRVLKVPLILP